MTADDYKYDAAISCLQEDEPLARELHHLLEPRVKSLFLYTQNQKELIGEEGIEKFSSVYRHESRVVIVIYRNGWGQTKWTGVEDRAIRELYLDGGWSRILVYSVDNTAPRWLPTTYLWAGKRYGLVPFAAAVEQKVQETGGTVGEEDVAAMAQRIRDSARAAEEREARRCGVEGTQAAAVERKAIQACLAELVEKLEPTVEGMKIQRAGADSVQGEIRKGVYTVWIGEIAAFFHWTGNTVNSIRGDKLILALGAFDIWGNVDNRRNLAKYELELAEDNTTWRWVEDGKGRYYTSAELANEAMRRLLQEHEKQRKAELERRRRQ